jgi:ABC-type multidrug transport system permease subunit
MLFSGYMININSIPVWLRWMQYISPLRYALEVGLTNEFKREDFVGKSFLL